MSTIKNSKYLQADTAIEDIPELIYERKELEELKNRVTGYFDGSEPAITRLVSGPSGSGKTVSVLYVIYNFIKQNPQFTKDFVYVSGTDFRTPKSLFGYIAGQLGVRGGKDMSSLIMNISKALNESQTKKIIIIDEVDKIYKNSRESPKYFFLHSLNRMDVRPRHSILMITNDFNLTKNFAAELRDSIIETTFDAYTSDDIFKILRKRANYCLSPASFTIEDLAKIAKEVFQNPIGGDKANIRYALNILSHAATLAQERSKLIYEVINEAISRVKIENYSKLLKKYNPHVVYLIKVLCQLKKKASIGIYKFQNPDLDYKEIKEDFYKLLDEEGAKAVSEVQFRRYIDQLVDENIVSRTNKARFNFLDDADPILEAIMKMGTIR